MQRLPFSVVLFVGERRRDEGEELEVLILYGKAPGEDMGMQLLSVKGMRKLLCEGVAGRG